MDPETPPVAPADLDATTPTTSETPATPAANTPFHPINTGTPLLNTSQQAAAKQGAAGIAASFKNVGQMSNEPTNSTFNAIYGTGQLAGAPAMNAPSQAVLTPNLPALSVNPAPSPALGAVNPANTQINAINAGMIQGQSAAISDRRAKTKIVSAKKDIFSFLNQLKVR